MSRRYARGFNLVELLLALGIGITLLCAFLVFQQHIRREFARNESLTSLQDAARQALGALVPDIEHAGFYGYSWSREHVLMAAGAELATQEDMSQPTAGRIVAAVAGLPANAHDCGVNFAVDLRRAVQGSDNRFSLGVSARDCEPTAAAGGASARSDTLTLRHASADPTTPRAGRLQLRANVRASRWPVQLFAEGRATSVIDSDHEVRDLEVRTYYVANSSVGRPGWPALRVKYLTESGGAVQFRDEEVMPGVEDLQVEFGIAAMEGGQAMLQFVPPESLAAEAGRIVSVRLWLRVRADSTEPGHVDTRAIRYANTTFTPDASNHMHRRMLVSRTVSVRNAPS